LTKEKVKDESSSKHRFEKKGFSTSNYEEESELF